MKNNTVDIIKLDDHDTLVIKKNYTNNFFVTTKDAIIIGIFNFSALIKYMVFSGIISPKVLEGILSEYYEGKES